MLRLMLSSRQTTLPLLTITVYLLDYLCDENSITVVPTKSDSDDMFCLQSYQELVIDKSLVY